MQYGTSLRLEGDTVGGEPANLYKYDDDGLLVGCGEQEFIRDAQSGLLASSTMRALTAEWTHNAFGEVTAHEERVNATPVYQVTYTRDLLGRIIRKSETINGAVTTEDYEFDGAGQLARVVRDGREYARYEYDGNGNRTRTVYANADLSGAFDNQDRLLTLGGTQYTYNGHGELQARSAPAGATSFVFDELGELRSAKTAAGRAIEYLVDADGKRVGRKVDGSLVDTYLYDADGSLAGWYDGNGGLRAVFVYGRRRHVPESMLSGGTLYRIVTDHIGSVRLVVDAASGAVAQQIDYDPFGRVLRDSKPGFQPFGFAGGLVDEHTGLVRFGVRDYDPETGRWISQDPLYFRTGSTNFYQYAANDPVNRSDPGGLWSAELSFGVGSVSLTWQEGVGLSGTVAIGATSPGGSISEGGEAFVPGDVESADFWSRDTKVSIEGKVGVGWGPIASVSGSVSLEQQADRYGIRCGPWSALSTKAELCVLGYCVEAPSGQTKTDLGQLGEIGRGETSTAPKASAEAVVKLEALIWSAR
jgi:RHS repeat-associated protein